MRIIIDRLNKTIKAGHGAVNETYNYVVTIDSPPTPSNTTVASTSVTRTFYQTWSAAAAYINGLSGSEPT